MSKLLHFIYRITKDMVSLITWPIVILLEEVLVGSWTDDIYATITKSIHISISDIFDVWTQKVTHTQNSFISSLNHTILPGSSFSYPSFLYIFLGIIGSRKMHPAQLE